MRVDELAQPAPVGLVSGHWVWMQQTFNGSLINMTLVIVSLANETTMFASVREGHVSIDHMLRFQAGVETNGLLSG